MPNESCGGFFFQGADPYSETLRPLFFFAVESERTDDRRNKDHGDQGGNGTERLLQRGTYHPDHGAAYN